MITMQDWMELVNYRITEGSDYGWQCYGHNAYQLDSWNGKQDGHSLGVLFDNKTQVVYEVQAHDYVNGRAYRMINPDYVDAHKNECATRGSIDCAWEDDEGNPVEYIDLDVNDDFIQKALAIVAGERDYDTRVLVPVDFNDQDLLTYMKMAHDMDITFNELVERALIQAIERHGIKDYA